MSIVATGSKVSRQNAWIILIMCVAFGLYFAYDGYMSEDYQRRHVEWPVKPGDFNDPVAFAVDLRLGTTPEAQHLFSQLSEPSQSLLLSMNPAAARGSEEFAQQLADELNMLMNRDNLFRDSPIPQDQLSDETKELMSRGTMPVEDIIILNHMILIDSFPNHIKPSTWHDGQATANLKFNRYYGPAVCALVALYFLAVIVRIPSYRIEADETGLKFHSGLKVPYSAIQQIDNRLFEKKGRFTITYDDKGAGKTLTLSRTQYDNLGVILAEIIKQTGAAPSSEPAAEDTATPDDSQA
ncbi:MAG: hypothetical protein JW936_09645 [Sedimentisphaerales bacterium]|nr:hypothetical protein [Sedimentisphaerales bacterium]